MKTKRNSSLKNPSKKLTTEIPNLPEEIISEILSRLPVKSLLRFRSVSKSWLSLISSSRFIKTHLTNATNNAMANHSVIFTVFYPKYDLQRCSVHSLLFQPLTVAHTSVDYPLKNLCRPVHVVGTCNGLVCIEVGIRDVFLWNPSTRTSKKLPPAGVPEEKNSCVFSMWGFGFDRCGDDYKVAGIFFVYGSEGFRGAILMIYSLKADSWKRVEDFKGGGIESAESCEFANGKFHFLAGKGLEDTYFRWDIVSLDLGTEVYGTIEHPNIGGGYRVSYLGALGGCICILCISRDSLSSDLWVMKDYGVRESWTKVVSIPFFTELEQPRFPKSLCMLPNGEILIVYGMHFAIYNPKGDSFRSLEISNIQGYIHRADIYVESLVNIHLSQSAKANI